MMTVEEDLGAESLGRFPLHRPGLRRRRTLAAGIDDALTPAARSAEGTPRLVQRSNSWPPAIAQTGGEIHRTETQYSKQDLIEDTAELANATAQAAESIDRMSRLSTDLANERTLLAWMRTALAVLRTALAIAFLGVSAGGWFW